MLPIYNRKSTFARRRLTQSELFTAFYQLSRCLDAGVALDDALDDISAGSYRRLGRHLWNRIGLSVKSGKTLSEALLCSGVHLDNTILALIRSGEVNGQLGVACQSVSDYLQWHMALRQRILTILIYPLFSLGMLVAVTAFLFISVVPAIEGFLLSTGDTLEWHTLLLLRVSDWITDYILIALYILAAVIGMVFSLVIINPDARQLFDRCLLKLPLVGAVLKDLLLSRYARCCAQLYSSGVALETSLQLAEQTVENRSLRADLASARHKMINGISFADALSSSASLPSMFTRLVAVGEKSGQLSTILVQIGEHQANAVDTSVSRLEQLIGPVLLVGVGAVLLWIVVSMLGPVYNMAIATVVSAS